MDRRKQRGQAHRCKRLLNDIDEFVPYQNIGNELEQEHFHVPGTPWIESPKTSGKVKTLFVKKWLEKTAEFIRLKPEGVPFCKVVAVIDEPYLWSSQIIIFYSEEYYKTFWDRKGPYQTWRFIEDKTKSFVKPRNIEVDFTEKGYHEVCIEDDYAIKSTLWFYGEL